MALKCTTKRLIQLSTNKGFNLPQTQFIEFLNPKYQSCINYEVVRTISKHWNPKFKHLRRLKVVKVDLPDFHEVDPQNMTKEEIRTKVKEKGIQPARPWRERSFFLSCTGAVFEPYVPPEGDGKMSIISKGGALQTAELVSKKSKSMMTIRKIRSYEEDFETKEFLQQAEDIYIKAHSVLRERDSEKLSDYATEKAIPEMMNSMKNKTLHWKFLKSLEPPRLVHCRHTDVISPTNLFAQITVRFHTQQLLAIYDRFGRLMYGSEILAKDVLEYVVFEKHLSSLYGVWRIHDKIIPNWMPKPEPAPKTFRKPLEEEPEPEPEVKVPDTATVEAIGAPKPVTV